MDAEDGLTPHGGRLTDLLTEKFEQAVERYGDGEAVYWDWSLTVVPSPQNGHPMPVVILFLSIPSGLVGEFSQAAPMINPMPLIGNDFAGVDEIVRQGLEAARQARTDALSLPDVVVEQNGHQSG